MRRFFVISYLIVLAMSVAWVVVLGVIVAPVIFNSGTLIAETISRYSQGVIMTEIFVRSNLWFGVVALYILGYELFDYFNGRRDTVVQIAAFVSVTTILLFVLYYTPDIVAMQQARMTQTEAFELTHKASEIDFKVLLVALGTLLVRRFMKLVHK